MPGIYILRKSTGGIIFLRTGTGAPRAKPFYLSAPANKFVALPNKNAPHFMRSICCPMRIRTPTYRARICRTTFILSGNLKNSFQARKIRNNCFRIFTPSVAGCSITVIFEDFETYGIFLSIMYLSASAGAY